jgi:small membrane protein
MSPFQWLALSVLGALLLRELLSLRRGHVHRGPWVVRCLTWLSAAAAIIHPQSVQKLAEWIGVGRGADAILYLVTLAFLLVSFYFYSRYVRLQRQLTQVVRHLAIQEARRGESLNVE